MGREGEGRGGGRRTEERAIAISRADATAVSCNHRDLPCVMRGVRNYRSNECVERKYAPIATARVSVCLCPPAPFRSLRNVTRIHQYPHFVSRIYFYVGINPRLLAKNDRAREVRSQTTEIRSLPMKKKKKKIS